MDLDILNKINLLFTVVILLFGACSSNKPTDRFVSIQGKEQHVLDIGEGKPVVVFITGLGDDLTGFSIIQTEISKITRTISYDRAGLGKSETLSNPRTVDFMASELNEILEHEKVPKPFILVGHSMGAFIIREYVKMYPEKVQAILFIDPSHEDFADLLKQTQTEQENQRQAARIGNLKSRYDSPRSKEMAGWDSSKLMMKGTTLPVDIPITVITSGYFSNDPKSVARNETAMKIWVTLHQNWMVDAPQIHHIITNKSGHYIHKEEPELVIREILNLL